MEYYNNSKSGISQYEIGEEYIDIKFKGGSIYRYTRSTCGVEHLFNMIVLATQNEGLNTYINIYDPGFVGQVQPISKQELRMLFAQNETNPITENEKKKKSARGNG